MAESKNKSPVTKVGNLTRDPELHFAKESGKPYTRFRIAVDRPANGNDWSGDRVTDFYEVTAFDQLAKNVNDCVRKGDRVMVQGRPELREFKDNDGNERTAKQIVANYVGAELRFATVAITRTKRDPEETTSDENHDDDEPF